MALSVRPGSECSETDAPFGAACGDRRIECVTQLQAGARAARIGTPFLTRHGHTRVDARIWAGAIGEGGTSSTRCAGTRRIAANRSRVALRTAVGIRTAERQRVRRTAIRAARAVANQGLERAGEYEVGRRNDRLESAEAGAHYAEFEEHREISRTSN